MEKLPLILKRSSARHVRGSLPSLTPEQIRSYSLNAEFRHYTDPYERAARMNISNLASVRTLATVFNLNKDRISRAVRAIRDGRSIGKTGKPCRLNEEQEQAVATWIRDRDDSDDAPMIPEVADHMREVLQMEDSNPASVEPVSSHCVRNFMKRNDMKAETIRTLPAERCITDGRVSEWFSDYRSLFEKKGPFKTCNIFNFDETWAHVDEKGKIKYVRPKDAPKKIQAHAQRKGDHITFGVFLCADPDNRFPTPIQV